MPQLGRIGLFPSRCALELLLTFKLKHTNQEESYTDREVTCCWEWALGRSLWGWPPTSELGTSGDVWLSFSVPNRAREQGKTNLHGSRVSFVGSTADSGWKKDLFATEGSQLLITLILLCEFMGEQGEREERAAEQTEHKDMKGAPTFHWK